MHSHSVLVRRSMHATGLVCVILATSLACSSNARDRARFDSGLPGMKTPMEVVAVHERGPYLQADLSFAGEDAEGWALPSDVCRAVFEPGTQVAYRDDGPHGSWVRGDQVCRSLGFGPMSRWRDRSSRATPQGVPRSQATYRTIHLDDDLALLRGVFPEAVRVGFERGDDLVAVVPRGGNCESPIASGVSSLEYRGKGRHPMSLVGAKGLCPVRAFLIPPGGLDSREAEVDPAGDR